MITYLDPSLLLRAYLGDEPDHEAAVALVGGDEHDLCTGSWSRIELTGAVVRAARDGRVVLDEVLEHLDLDLAGPIAEVAVPQDQVERGALELARAHGLRAGDCWHLAAAQVALPLLAFEGDPIGFATRDARQAEVATEVGFELL